MKLVVLRSVPAAPGAAAADEYSQEADTRYAERVLGNLSGGADFCTACAPDCSGCRAPYGRDFSRELAAVVDLPALLPHVLERPGEHVPARPPPHDVILAVAVHEQILIEVLKRAGDWGTRALVAPLEAPGWISPAARAEAFSLAESLGVELAFPKPFCAFRPPAGSLLERFRRHFRIGFPEVELIVTGGLIKEARVEVSAACGATYYVARWLAGRRVDDDLRYGVVAKRLHSYPCTASMEWDDELGDTVMHVAGQAHYEILGQLGPESGAGAGAGAGARPFVSPAGVVLPGAPRPQESLDNIERAREIIMEELARSGSLRIEELGRYRGIPPAAFYSALLILKKAGKVRVRDRLVTGGA